MSEGRVLLGIHQGAEYYLNTRSGEIEWRVPDTREAVRAQPGHRILGADYSQIEVRLMAYLSGDPGLIAAINKGGDIHCYTAVDCFGEELHFDYDTINKARKNENHPRHDELKAIRNDTKCCTFGIPYGAGPPRIAAQTGRTIDDAASIIARFFAKYPVLKTWLEQQGSDAIRYGFSSAPRGHKRWYTLPSADDENAEQILSQIRRYAGNFPIQCGNVEMLKPAMYRIYCRLREAGYTHEQARIIFVVHDEIVMTALAELAPTLEEKKARGFDPGNRDLAYRLQWAGPIERIMMEEMQGAYESIVSGIINQIDVSVDDLWVKD